MEARKKKQKRKIEWSQLFASIIAGAFGIFGMWATVEYYQLCELAITSQCATLPDSGVPTTCITVVIGALMSYLLYQAGLKNSRNKYGIDSEGQPFRRKEIDPDENQ